VPVTFSQIEVSIQVSAKMVTTHEESGSFGVRHTRNVSRADEPRRPFRAALCPLRALSRQLYRARLEGQTRHASCRCDGILPLRGSFGSEDP
jgi:hypothetical protein